MVIFEIERLTDGRASTLLKAYAAQIAARFAPQIFAFISSIILVRSAGIGVFGQYAVATAISLLTIGTLCSALDMNFLRSGHRERFRTVLAAKLVLFVLSVPLVLLLFVVSSIPIVAGLIVHAATWLSYVTESAIVLGRLEATDFEGSRSKILGWTLVTLVYALVRPANLLQIGSLMILGWACAAAVSLVRLNSRNSTMWDDVFREIKDAKHLFLVALFTQVYGTVDIYLLRQFTTEAESGLYRLAQGLSSPLMVGFGALSMVQLSTISAYLKREELESIRRALGRQVGAVSLIGASSIVLGLLIYPWIFTNLYLLQPYPVSYVAIAMLVGYSIGGWASTYTNVILVMRGDSKIATVAGVTAVGNVLLNLVLIPIWGAAGAACTLILTNVAIAGFLGLVVASYLKNKASA